MSLEGLSETQVKQLATGMNALLNSKNAAIRRGAQKLLKEVDPTLNFPEIEMEAAIQEAVKPLKEDNEKLRNELQERTFTSSIQEEHKKVVSRGFKVEDVQKFMKENGIVNYDTAMSFMDMQTRLAAPTPQSLAGNFDLPGAKKDDLEAAFWKNPTKAARDVAHGLLNKFRAEKGMA